MEPGLSELPHPEAGVCGHCCGCRLRGGVVSRRRGCEKDGVVGVVSGHAAGKGLAGAGSGRRGGPVSSRVGEVGAEKDGGYGP